MSDYLNVRYDGSDEAMLGNEYEFSDLASWGNFDEMLTAKLQEMYPGVDVAVSFGSHDTKVDTSLDNEDYVIDDVREAVNQVWQQWLETIEYA